MVVSPPGMHGFSGEEYFVRPIHYAWVVGETAPFPCHSFIVFKLIMPPNAVNSFNSNLNSLSVIAFVFQGCWNSVVFVCLLFDHGRMVCFCGYGLLPFCNAKVGWVGVRMCRFSAVFARSIFFYSVFLGVGRFGSCNGENLLLLAWRSTFTVVEIQSGGIAGQKTKRESHVVPDRNSEF